jgi:hypothetical protein
MPLTVTISPNNGSLEREQNQFRLPNRPVGGELLKCERAHLDNACEQHDAEQHHKQLSTNNGEVGNLYT